MFLNLSTSALLLQGLRQLVVFPIINSKEKNPQPCPKSRLQFGRNLHIGHSGLGYYTMSRRHWRLSHFNKVFPDHCSDVRHFNERWVACFLWETSDNILEASFMSYFCESPVVLTLLHTHIHPPSCNSGCSIFIINFYLYVLSLIIIIICQNHSFKIYPYETHHKNPIELLQLFRTSTQRKSH